MKKEDKISIIDSMIIFYEEELIRASKLSKTSSGHTKSHTSGMCAVASAICLERFESHPEGKSWKEDLEFTKFINLNRPTEHNKWKEFADLDRVNKSWWWEMFAIEPRLKFLKALRESLINKTK